MIFSIFITAPSQIDGPVKYLFKIPFFERYVSIKLEEDKLLPNFFLTTLVFAHEEGHINVYSSEEVDRLDISQYIFQREKTICYKRKINALVVGESEAEAIKLLRCSWPGFGQDLESAAWLDKEEEIKKIACRFMYLEKGKVSCQGGNHKGSCALDKKEKYFYPLFCPFG